MKYVVMDYANGDLFTTECETLEKAISEADKQWGYLTRREKQQRDFFILLSENPDEDAENHLSGDVVKAYKED